MIDDLDDLITYSERVSHPDIGDPPLTEPGLSDAELDELRERFPGLPESYLECLSRLQVFGRRIGPFRLSPPPDDENGPTLVDALEWWNDNLHLSDEMEERGLVEVAAAENDSLTVQRGGDGRVIWLDWRSDDDVVERDLAPSFCDLLLLIGRYDEAIAKADEEGAEEPDPDDLVEQIGDGIDLTDEQRENLALLLS
jgi:hypothetical protein